MMNQNQGATQSGDVVVRTWFERDRSHVALVQLDSDETIIEWWDEDVTDLVNDGFLDPQDWQGSAFKYAQHLGVI